MDNLYSIGQRWRIVVFDARRKTHTVSEFYNLVSRNAFLDVYFKSGSNPDYLNELHFEEFRYELPVETESSGRDLFNAWRHLNEPESRFVQLELF